MPTVTKSGPVTRLKMTHDSATAWVDGTSFHLFIPDSPPSPSAMSLLAVLKDAFFLRATSVTVEVEKNPKTGAMTLQSIDVSQ